VSSLEQINVKTNNFDGPLSLLLMLIKKEQMNIEDLDLTVLTKQYLDYVNVMKGINFDIAGDYLLMASSLVYLKSNSCLSQEYDKLDELEDELNDENSDSQLFSSKEELINRLQQLEKYQNLGEKLLELPQQNINHFKRPKTKKNKENLRVLEDIDSNLLVQSMMDLLKRESREVTIMDREKISIKDKLLRLREFLIQGQKYTFKDLLEFDQNNYKTARSNQIISFICLLELARLEKIRMFQVEESNEIYFDVLANLKKFDVNFADGFDEESDAHLDETQNLSESQAGDEHKLQ
jgi:segregation and condensation protein A